MNQTSTLYPKVDGKRQSTVVLSERRRLGSEGWIDLPELHRQEKARAERLLQMTGIEARRNCFVAIDPDCGLLSLQEAQDANGQPMIGTLDSGTPFTEQWLELKSSAMAERAKKLNACATDLIAQIRNGDCKTQEHFFAQIPHNLDLRELRSFFAQAGRERIELDSSLGPIVYGGGTAIPSTLPSERSFEVLAEVRAVDRDDRPKASVSFSVLSVFPGLTDTKYGPLEKGRTMSASLSTSSDARALALVCYSIFLSEPIKLRVQMRFDLLKVKWSATVLEILNEEELVKQDSRAQKVLADW